MRTQRTAVGLVLAATIAGGLLAGGTVVSVSTSGSDIFYDLAPVTAPDGQSTAVTDAAAVAPAPSPIFYDL